MLIRPAFIFNLDQYLIMRHIDLLKQKRGVGNAFWFFGYVYIYI